MMNAISLKQGIIIQKCVPNMKDYTPINAHKVNKKKVTFKIIKITQLYILIRGKTLKSR